ncbi:Hydrolase TatD [Balamuthia mandrillaris]
MENPGNTSSSSNANARQDKARNSRVKQQQQQSKKQQQQAAAKSPAGKKSAATYTASSPLPQRDLRATEALPFFDSHCHLDLILEREGAQTASQVIERFEGFYEQNFSDEAVDRVNASVDPTCSLPVHFHFDGCLQICCFLSGYKVTKQMVESKPNVWATYGIHPHQASDYTDELEEEICQLMAHPKTVAWGEMGLDYFKNMSPAEVQRTVFEKQLKRAVSLGKPLVIHTRDADEDTLRIMKENVPPETKIHMHCFGSGWDMAEALMAHFPNLWFGFTGVITFGSAQQSRDVVKQLPLDRLLLETDSPFMAPVPHRGKTGHPGMIPLVAAKIAEVKQETIETVVRVTRENTRKMYGI